MSVTGQVTSLRGSSSTMSLSNQLKVLTRLYTSCVCNCPPSLQGKAVLIMSSPQVSFGVPDEVEDSHGGPNLERPGFKPKPVSFANPDATGGGNKFLDKIGSILTRPATPPVSTSISHPTTL